MPPTHIDKENSFASLMRCGSQLHAEGQLEATLSAFQNALALRPTDTNAACATAALLSALSRPLAAYRVLLTVENELLDQPDGACNLAIAAECCGYMVKAISAYQRTLQLDANHLRALSNMALLAAAESNWADAIGWAQKCVALDPDDAGYRQNLADHLAGAGRYAEALEVLEVAAVRFADYLDITVRRIIVLAFNGDFEKSRQLEATLDESGQSHLLAFVTRSLASTKGTSADSGPQTIKRDAFELYTSQAFAAMNVCDWRSNEQLTAHLRAVLADPTDITRHTDWREVAFYAQTLDLRDAEPTALNDLRNDTSTLTEASAIPVFATTRKTTQRQADPRIHVGLAAYGLHDAYHLQALKQQLALHDKTRFAIHVYSCTREPELKQEQTLKPYAASVSQMAHMSDAEVAGRVRLDQLDLFVDLNPGPSARRPGIADLRVAPIQVCQTSWQRHVAGGPFEYTLSDGVVHPVGNHTSDSSNLARLPLTCWLALRDDRPSLAVPSREAVGLPATGLILCAMFEPAQLDPGTFGHWMRILNALPGAVLWLPGCSAVVKTNLSAQGQAAGVLASQIVFTEESSRPDLLARLKHADLFLDTLRFNSVQGLEDALRAGLPAISCAGSDMASRLGASLLNAAGLPDCVLATQEEYVAEAIRLGQHPTALKALRERLRSAHSTAPLFDAAARIKELEAAWTHMIDRSRAGLPPASFDVPRAGTSG